MTLWQVMQPAPQDCYVVHDDYKIQIRKKEKIDGWYLEMKFIQAKRTSNLKTSEVTKLVGSHLTSLGSTSVWLIWTLNVIHKLRPFSKTEAYWSSPHRALVCGIRIGNGMIGVNHIRMLHRLVLHLVWNVIGLVDSIGWRPCGIEWWGLRFGR